MTARELMWLMSAATPGVPTTSYRDSWLTRGEICEPTGASRQHRLGILCATAHVALQCARLDPSEASLSALMCLKLYLRDSVASSILVHIPQKTCMPISHLHQQAQRLANAAGGTQNNDLALRHMRRRKAAGASRREGLSGLQEQVHGCEGSVAS